MEEIIEYNQKKHGDIPIRFIAACKGNREDAAKRWATTAEWRLSEKIDELLEKPQHKFHDIKANYPQYVHGKAKNGHYVYYERPGLADFSVLTKIADSDELLLYYVYTTEWIWRVLDPREEGRLVSVWDMTGASASSLVGDRLKMLKRTMGVISEHYPERSDKLFIINAPFWFSATWRMVSPWIDPTTRNKISILGGGYSSALNEYIGAENVPEMFGGTDRRKLGESQEEDKLRDFVEEKIRYVEEVRRSELMAEERSTVMETSVMETSQHTDQDPDETDSNYDTVSDGEGPQQTSQHPATHKHASAEDFKLAALRVAAKDFPETSSEQKLQLYGLFKQSTKGTCSKSRPGILDPVGRAKFDAWAEYKALDQDQARYEYITLVKSIEPSFTLPPPTPPQTIPTLVPQTLPEPASCPLPLSDSIDESPKFSAMVTETLVGASGHEALSIGTGVEAVSVEALDRLMAAVEDASRALDQSRKGILELIDVRNAQKLLMDEVKGRKAGLQNQMLSLCGNDEHLSGGGGGGVSLTLTMQLRRICKEAERLCERGNEVQLLLDSSEAALEAAEQVADALVDEKREISRRLSELLAIAVNI
mmetsp:Transcript_49755/g.63745  ORF Transcript_49755/g.63745 Transcript_49755/m.63745 type:complete len:594 (-) Transcript_49755:116-1897(-)